MPDTCQFKVLFCSLAVSGMCFRLCIWLDQREFVPIFTRLAAIFFHRSISIKSFIGRIPYTGQNDILNVSQDIDVKGFHVQALADGRGCGLLADLFRKPTY